MLKFPVLQSFRVNSIWVVNGTIPLRDSDTRGPGTCQITTRVQTHVTKTLNDIGFSSPAREVADHAHVMSFIDEIVKTMENTSSSGTGPPVYTSLVDGLASDTGTCIHVSVTDGVGISISYPCHFSFSSSHVRSRHINSRPQETLLGQLN